MNRKVKHLAVFVLKKKGTYEIEKIKRFSPTKTTIRFRGGTYIPRTEDPTYTRGLKQFYVIDLKGKEHLSFFKFNKSLAEDPKLLDAIISRSIIGQLTANLGDGGWKLSLTTLFIGIALGGAFGYIIAGFL